MIFSDLIRTKSLLLLFLVLGPLATVSGQDLSIRYTPTGVADNDFIFSVDCDGVACTDSQKNRFDFFWIFPDGSYHVGDSAQKIIANPGSEVILAATRIYDDDDNEAKISKLEIYREIVDVDGAATAGPITPAIQFNGNNMGLEVSRNPRPNYPFFYIIDYKNPLPDPSNGEIRLRYDEKLTLDPNFWMEPKLIFPTELGNSIRLEEVESYEGSGPRHEMVIMLNEAPEEDSGRVFIAMYVPQRKRK